MEVTLLEAGGSGRVRSQTRGPHHLRGTDVSDDSLIKLARIARTELRSAKVMLMRPHTKVLGEGLYGIVGRVCNTLQACVAVKINTRTPLGNGNRAENAALRLVATVAAAAPFAVRLLEGDERVTITDVVEPLADGIASLTQWVRLAPRAALAQHLPAVLLQATWFCAAMQAAFPDWRHNDLHGTNVLVTRGKHEEELLVLDAGEDGATQFRLAADAPRLKVIDFGLAHDPTSAPNPDVAHPSAESELPRAGVVPRRSRTFDLTTLSMSVLRELTERGAECADILSAFRGWLDRFVGGVIFERDGLDPDFGRMTPAAQAAAERAIEARSGAAQAPLDLLLAPDPYWDSLVGPVGDGSVLARMDLSIKTWTTTPARSEEAPMRSSA